MSKSVSTASNDPPPQVQVAPSLTPGGAPSRSLFNIELAATAYRR